MCTRKVVGVSLEVALLMLYPGGAQADQRLESVPLRRFERTIAPDRLPFFMGSEIVACRKRLQGLLMAYRFMILIKRFDLIFCWS